MKSFISLFLLGSVLFLLSCEEKCQCERVIYESHNENNYIFTETSREKTDLCQPDTMSSTYLDNNGNIYYVNTITECN